jgi:phage antirepressor YoqD-like protein
MILKIFTTLTHYALRLLAIHGLTLVGNLVHFKVKIAILERRLFAFLARNRVVSKQVICR